MFFIKLIAIEMKIYKTMHFIKQVQHILPVLDVTASSAQRKMLKRYLWRTPFSRTSLSGTCRWICSQHLITKLNLDLYQQLFIATKNQPNFGEVLRKYLLLLALGSGNKLVGAEQCPCTDHHRNGFPLGKELCPRILRAEVPLKFNSTSRNPSWDI